MGATPLFHPQTGAELDHVDTAVRPRCRGGLIELNGITRWFWKV